MARLVCIGVKIGPLVASSSWPGLSGPSLSAPAATDGSDKPGHDGVATIVPSAGYLSAYVGQALPHAQILESIRRGHCYFVMARLVRATYTRTCRDRWPR